MCNIIVKIEFPVSLSLCLSPLYLSPFSTLPSLSLSLSLLFLPPLPSRGTEEHLSCEGKVDIINSTLGKALGGAAGNTNTCLTSNN